MRLYLVCEDVLSEIVMRKLVKAVFQIEIDLIAIGKKGQGFIKDRINQYNSAKDDILFFVLTDLDQEECAPKLINDWFKRPVRKNLLFRVAVREVEAWLLADSEGFSKFVNLDKNLIDRETRYIETINDPKKKLIALVNRCRERTLKEDIVASNMKTANQGPGYNTRLKTFVEDYWDVNRAKINSNSLDRTIKALQKQKKRVIHEND
jgi:hypothetical protein